MVQAALRALAKEGPSNGFTEDAISRYIISAYPGIPPGHPNLLPYYLRKLVTARELSVSPSGHYLLPDSCLSEPIAPPPPFPRPNALPSLKSSLVLRLRKTVSDGDGSEGKDSWCYIGDGSTSSPSVTEQQSGSVATKPGGESYPLVPALMQADPEKALLPPSPSLGWLDEPKEPLVVPSPVNKKQSSKSRKAGGESGPPVPASMQAEPEKALLPPSPSPASDINMEEPLVVLFPINKKQSRSKSRKRAVTKPRKQECEFRKRDMRSEIKKAGEELRPPTDSMKRETRSETKKKGRELRPLISVSMKRKTRCETKKKDRELRPPISVSMKRKTRSENKKKGRELRPLVPVSMQAEPEKAPSPCPDSDTNMEITLGLDEPKESLTGLCPISHPSILISKQSELEKTLLPPSPSPVSQSNMEGILPTLGWLDEPKNQSNMEGILPTLGWLDEPKKPLVVLSPINEQQSGSKFRKRAGTKSRKQELRSETMKRKTRSETKKKNGELRPPFSASMQAEPEKVPSPSPTSDTNMEVTSPALGLDEPKESLCPINIQQSRSEYRKQDGEPGSDAKKVGEESHLSVSISKQSEPEKALLPPFPVSVPNMEGISQKLGLVEPKELLAVQSSVEEQLANKNVESHLPVPVSMQLEPEEALTGKQVGSENGESSVALSPIIEKQFRSKNGESQVLTPITKQQLGSENGESHPPVPASMQIEPEEVLLSPPPLSDLNLEFTSPILGPDKPKESLPILVPIAEQESENESRKRDGEAHLPTTVSIHTKLENPPLLPHVSDPNMEWAYQVLAFNELKESSLVSHPITNQQSGSDPGKQDRKSHLLAPDSKQANSEEVLSLPLPPSPPVLGQLQTEPVPYLPKKTSSPAPLNNEPNRERSSPALMLYELKESLPVSTPIANQQSGSESSKIDADSHPPNSELMQQPDPGKEPPPPPISVQSQAEPELKLSSTDCVPEKSSLPEKPSVALGEKKSLSKKPRPKHRKVWFEM